jgi:hypothetical protein
MEVGGEPTEATGSWFPPDGSDWVLTFQLKTINGRVECIGMEIRSFTGREPLTAKRLRELPFARELERARQSELDRNELMMDLARRMGGRIPELEEANSLLLSGKPRQRARYTHKDLQRVATVYRELWLGDGKSPGSKSPTRDTANVLGLRYQQAAKLVQRCRRNGLLPQTDQGVARGSTEETE